MTPGRRRPAIDGSLRRLRTVALRAWGPILGLGLATVVALVLEAAPVWRSLADWLASLGFDPERVLMIQTCLAGMVLATFTTLILGRWWPAVLGAGLFVWVSYVWPLGDRLVHDVPRLFGMREVVHVGMIQHNQLVILAAAVLLAVPGAGIGAMLRAGLVRLQSGQHGFPLGRSGHRLARVLATTFFVVVVGTSGVLAPGIDPVLRYGPTVGVYAPAATGAHLPGSGTAEVVPVAGTVLSRVYPSEAMGEDRHYLIYLPPTYGLHAAASRHYPVLYLLHGDPGAPSQWTVLGAPGLVDAGAASGVLPEMLIVMPDGNGHHGAFTDWANSADGRNRVESALLELVAVVDRDYRTVADRNYRLIGGLSSGAFGAANLAARNPDVFGTAMSFSGYYVATNPTIGSGPTARANSPYFLVQDRPQARTVHYILAVGNADPRYQRTTAAFDDLLTRLHVNHDLFVVPGGHGGGVWSQGLALALTREAAMLSHPKGVVSEGHDRHRY